MANAAVAGTSNPGYSIWRVIMASSVGTMIEWYDFYIFGSLTAILALKFYPTGNDTFAYLAYLATFAVGFLVRPFGALFFGRIGDLVGRKYAFIVTLSIMGFSTFAIGLLPSFKTAGWFAPIVLLLIRVLQGLALGGEYGGAAVYVGEHVPDNKRGFYTSFIQITATLGLFVSLLVILGTQNSMSKEEFSDWGWRIPFLFGLVIGPVGLYIRNSLAETQAFLQSDQTSQSRTAGRRVLASHIKQILACFGIVVSGTISFYVILVYIPTFARSQLQLPLDQAFLAQAIGLACEVALIPICGALSDRIGRKPVMIASLLLSLVVTYPLFMWVSSSPSFSRLLVMQVVLCSVFGIGNGPVSTALGEQFPTRVRSTALAIGYNVAVMLFGGFAPFFVTWLIHATGTPIAPAFYLMFGAAVGLFAVLFLTERAGERQLAVPDMVEPHAA